MQKRPIIRKRDLFPCKRDVCICKRDIHIPKRPQFLSFSALQVTVFQPENHVLSHRCLQKRRIHMQKRNTHIQKRSLSSPFLSLYKSLFFMGTFAQKRHIHMQKRCIHVQTRSLSSPFLPLFKSRRFNPNIMSYRVGAPKRDLFICKREIFIHQRDLFIRQKYTFICKRELSPSIFSRFPRHGISTRKL